MEKQTTTEQRYFPNPKFNNRAERDGYVCASPTNGVIWCVAAKIDSSGVRVRDTKDLKDTTLHFSHEEWRAFVKGVKLGEFDI